MYVITINKVNVSDGRTDGQTTFSSQYRDVFRAVKKRELASTPALSPPVPLPL